MVRSGAMREISGEGSRFVAVGAINTVVGYGVFFVLVTWVFSELRFGYLLALVLSYVVATPLGYTLHRIVVFRASASWASFGRFIVINVSAIVANLVGLPVAVEIVGLSPQIGQAVVLGIVVVGSYLGHRFITFRASNQG